MKTDSARERADAGPRQLQGDRPAAPFEVRRVVMVDSDQRQVLAEMGHAGVGWISFDDFPIGSPVWRSLNDVEFCKLHRSIRAAGPRERR